MMEEAAVNDLRTELAGLREEIALLRDESEIRRIQYLYGYYDDYRDWDRLLGLFADACSVEIGTRGCYDGIEQVGRFFREVIGQNRAFLLPTEIYNHLQLQMIITVRPDRNRAHARSRALIQGAIDGGPAMAWAEGVYENTFVRIGGEWKIEHMYWAPTFYSKVTGIESLYFSGAPASLDIPPDRPAIEADPPHGRKLVPYHFSNDGRAGEPAEHSQDPGGLPRAS